MPLAFSLHVMEEWPGFTQWAVRHASPLFTQREYAVIHLGGIAGAVLLAGLVGRFPNRGTTFLLFAFFFLPSMLWNVVFHVGATIPFQAYCPGLVTAVCLYPLVVWIVSRSALREGLLSRATGAAALVVAGFFHCWDLRCPPPSC